MSAKSEWTPYGLEAIRVRYLRRRRLLALLLALGLAGLWAFMFEVTTISQQEIFVNGKRAGGIQIDVPEERQNDGPVTVSLDPGRVTRADTGGAPEEEGARRTTLPTFERAPARNYGAYAFMYGPYLLLAAALFFLAKKRGKHDQVNYGIYKGAMPLEMISASMSPQVFTTRWAKTSLFGKRPIDHLPAEVAAIERVPQDDEEVTKA